jgi:hypothetical protein
MSAKLNNNHTNAPWSKREQKVIRRDEAFARELSRSKRLPTEQLFLITERRGESKRESDKLRTLIDP